MLPCQPNWTWRRSTHSQVYHHHPAWHCLARSYYASPQRNVGHDNPSKHHNVYYNSTTNPPIHWPQACRRFCARNFDEMQGGPNSTPCPDQNLTLTNRAKTHGVTNQPWRSQRQREQHLSLANCLRGNLPCNPILRKSPGQHVLPTRTPPNPQRNAEDTDITSANKLL